MSFSCSDKDALIAYVYGECDSRTRDAVELHLTTCPACADEVSGFGVVRHALTEWKTPERVGGFRMVREEAAAEAAPAKVLRPARWWQAPLPALARVAAAILLFAGGAALANLEVRYDKDGFVVRTGWRQPAPAPQAVSADASKPAAVVTPASAESAPDATPWRTEMASLERQLRDEFRAQIAAVRASAPAQAAQPVQVAATGFDEAHFMQRVHTLLDESERRQEAVMTFHVNQVESKIQAQRRADLIRIQQIGLIEAPSLSIQQKRQMTGELFPASLKR